MTVHEILSGAGLTRELPQALRTLPVTGLQYDSRTVEPGFLFFAFAGSRADGRQFAAQAVERGAIAVVSELPAPSGFKAPWIEVRHGRTALAVAAKNFYRRLDEKLCLTGITGTNGKTTTAFLADAVLSAAGKTTALIGTVEYRLAGTKLPAVNTTPESLDIFRLLDRLNRAGGTHLTMEVSSHALALGRVHGISFHTAVFTNLTRDHLDFHNTMEDYFAAKRLLFAPESAPAPRWAAINADDEYGRKIQSAAESHLLTYGFAEQAAVRATDFATDFNGLSFTLAWEGHSVPVRSPLVGRINVYNILAACCVAISYGLELSMISQAIEQCPAVPGRFERIDEGQPFMVVVDYAHTDDALRNVIAVAREMGPRRVITVFGCGGDRDRTKRPLMGMAAAGGSDFVVLTSDNPRSEDPLAIMNDVMVGMGRFDTPRIAEPDRGKAIRAALNEAQRGDIVILAGKGHEPYQVFSDRTIHFDDRECAREVLHAMGYHK